MKRTPKLNEEILDIVPFKDLGLKTSLICIITKAKVSNGIFVGYKKYEVNKYFILKEVSERLGYDSKSLTSKCRNISIDDDKYLLTKDSITNFKPGGYAGFGSSLYTTNLLSIPNRGILVLNLAGFCKLIMNSTKPEVKKFQQWVYSFVIPRAIEIGYYLDSDNLYMDLYSKFTKMYYSYNVDTRYHTPTIVLGSIENYNLFMKENNYFCLVEDYQFQTRIYDAAYYNVFGRTYSSLFSNDPTVYTTKNNPFESARELGGLLGVRSIDITIKFILNSLELGYTIESIENMLIINRGLQNNASVLSIPNGYMYKMTQESKRSNDINNIS